MRVSPSLLMVGSTLFFAAMALAVKLASARYGVGEIVMYRGLIGATAIAVIVRLRGGTLATPLPGAHFWRSLTGVVSLGLWFYCLGRLPLATAMTLNYMSSVWLALFLVGGAVVVGGSRIDPRLIATVLAGFAGVAGVLRPTLDGGEAWAGVAGLLSGMLAATAYLQVASLGRAGEPDWRIVFYFSIGACASGAAATWFEGGFHAHTPAGLALLLTVGACATLAQLLLTRAYAVGRPLVNASLQYLGIAWSFLIGVMVFDDPVTLPALGGMILIVGAGIAAARLRQSSLAPRAAAARTAAPQEAPAAEADELVVDRLPARPDS